MSFLLCFCVLLNFSLAAQPGKAVNDAFLITRMAEKFHFQPKPLNDEFSSHIYTQLLKQLDEDRIFFTAQDIQALSKFQLQIDDEIKNRKGSFLSLITKLYNDRIVRVDTMIDNICKQPFNFTLAEKITVAEDTSWPADEKAARTKLYKIIKSQVLDYIVDDERIVKLNPAQQKKYADSIEPIARRKVQKMYKHTFQVTLRGAGGIAQFVGDEYCKSIAVCYDPHTEYFPLTEKENFDSQLGQQSMAFGFNFKEDDDGSVKVENLAPGSPAFKSGQINKGDKIEAVQWGDQKPIDVSDGGVRQLSEVLRMSNHDKATLTIKKPDGSERAVTLWKAQLEDDGQDDKVKSFLLKGAKTIGFISLPAFYEDWEDEDEGIKGCANDVAKEILKLKRENIQGLILDLRYNGGGSMQEAIQLAGIFIDAGPVGQFKSRESKVYTLKDMNRGTIYDGPLMLLVNGYSASASEMLAGTLQDYNRAVIVGSPTYGKATAQVVLPMDTTINPDSDNSKKKSDSYLKVTVSQLYRVNGTTAQASGVRPDIMLPDMLEASGEREADNSNVLISSPIEGSKYFKPLPVNDLNNLKVVAKTDVEASPFFSYLKNYIETEKAGKQKKDVSLKLSDAIEDEKRSSAAADTSSFKKLKAPYTTEDNSYDKQQSQVNGNLKEMNDQWKKFLDADPYLHVAYDVMLKMTK